MRSKVLLYLFAFISFLIVNSLCRSQDCKNYTLVLEPHLLFLTSAVLYEDGKEKPIFTIEYSFFEWTISHTHQIINSSGDIVYKSYNSVFNLYDSLYIYTFDKSNHQEKAYTFSKTHPMSSSKALSDEYQLEKTGVHNLGKILINMERLDEFEFHNFQDEQIARGFLHENKFKMLVCHVQDHPDLHLLLSMFLTTKVSMHKIADEI